MNEPAYVPPTTDGAAAQSSGSGGWDKILIGCGLGCGVLLLLAIVIAVGVGIWVLQPGTQHETDIVVGEETTGVIRLRDVGKDPGTQEFLTHALQSINEANRRVQEEQLPENMRWLAGMGNQNASPAGLNMFIPKDLTIGLEARDPQELSELEEIGYVEDGDLADSDDLALTIAINFRTMVRPIKAMIEWGAEQEQSTVEVHNGHKILDMDGMWTTFVGSTLMVSDSMSALRASLDRLDRGAVARQWQVDLPEGDWDFYGVLGPEVASGAMSLDESFIGGSDDEDGEDGETGEDGEEEPAFDLQAKLDDPLLRLEHVTFGIDLQSADALEASLRYTMESEDAATSFHDDLRDQLARMKQSAEDEGLTLDSDLRREGSALQVDLQVTGLEAKIASFADWVADIQSP